jgi:hypothetical protein
MEVDLESGMGIDALEHLDEVAIGINPLEATRGEQALDNADISRAHLGPVKQPIFTADCDCPNLALQRVSAQGTLG